MALGSLTRLSHLFGRTLRVEPPTSVPGIGLAQRAGLARMMGNRLVFLPLGARVLGRLKDSLHRSIPMDALPVLPPGDSTEEFWRELVAGEIGSYRQLPSHVYAERSIAQAEPPWSAERPALQWVCAAGGEEQMEVDGELWRKGLEAWLGGAGVPAVPSALEGRARNWVIAHPKGPSLFLRCAACGYLAPQETARFRRPEPTRAEPEVMRMAETPGATTIQALAAMLDIDPQDTLKALFFVTKRNELVFVMLRGDREVSLTKLTWVIGCDIASRAAEQVIRESGAEPGYASPVGLHVGSREEPDGILVVGDLSLLESASFVAGANKPGYHLLGVNYPRDFRVTHLADITAARALDPCPECGQPMAEEPGMVLAQWSTIPRAFDFAEASGNQTAGLMGIGTVFLDAMLGAFLATHSDERGLSLPASVAPYPVHVVSLGQMSSAEPFVRKLLEAGLDVLWDDREASAGVKFADADLIGCPVRVTVSRRSIEKGGAEVSRRGGGEPKVVAEDLLLEAVQSLM